MNLQITLIIATLIAALLIFFVQYHILFRGGVVKKKYFLLLTFSIFLVLIGHLLELTGRNTSGAFSGVRLLYLGSAFVSSCLLFFVADYCDIKIPNLIRALIIAAAAAYAAIAWTTNITGLLYASMEYDAGHTYYLLYTPGPLSLLSRVFPMLHAAAAAVMLVYRIRRSGRRGRAALIVMLVATILPSICETAFYVLSLVGYTRVNIYITPYVLAAIVTFIYYGIMRYDIDVDAVAAIVAMDTISEPFILLDSELCVLSSNNAARTLFPWLRDLPRDAPVNTRREWPEALPRSTFTNENISVEFTLREDDRRFSASVNPTAVRRRSELSLWSILIRDVTESANFIKRLEEAAYTDKLTGLYNRRHFSEIATPFIERARRSGMPYYFMIVDIDDFKDVNDIYGHLAGDVVLRGMAQVMKQTVRPYDIIARWGGEEFCLIITDIDEAGVLRLAERIRYGVETYECEFMGKPLRVTISLGVAKNDDDCDITELTMRADEALYTAKNTGKNRVVMWSPGRSEPAI